MRQVLEYVLKKLAQVMLWKEQPLVIGITGSVGKSSLKEALYTVLQGKFFVRRNLKSYNNEIGVPLTILGLEGAGSSWLGWLKVIIQAIFKIIGQRKYPEILILELAVDKPGDMSYLLSFVPVSIGIITAIGQFPVHLEFFPEKDKLIEEKAQLVKALPADGLAILNYDDLSVRMIGDQLPSQLKTIYYGFGQGADLRMSNYELKTEEIDKGRVGISFKLEYQGSLVPIRVNQVLGRQQAYALTAAVATALRLGLHLVEISAALSKYQSLPGRTKLIPGIKKTWIIDDSYNASPSATIAALDILKNLPTDGQREKIAVLGDMLELGPETEAGHRQVGQKVLFLDQLFLLGERSRFIADEAKKQGLAPEKIHCFSQAEELALELQKRIKPTAYILIKGSRAMRMEKIVKEIMLNPEEADSLLVN